MTRRLWLVSSLAAVILAGCGGSNRSDSKAAAPSATSASAPAAVASGLKGTANVTVSGAISGAFEGPVAYNGCGPLGANKQAYHVFASAAMNGHTVELRLEIPEGYHGPGDYTFHMVVTGRFDDQTAKLRWADVANATGPYGSGTVTLTTDTAGTFDVIMLRAPYTPDDPSPPASQVHLAGTWSC